MFWHIQRNKYRYRFYLRILQQVHDQQPNFVQPIHAVRGLYSCQPRQYTGFAISLQKLTQIHKKQT